ncbi:MAG: 2-C-methyl-D-erythritol 4-phosphate cytidylyltransferase [Planctomycetes bacterium]|nr:2-C-methyl-D-erythritol 4-phosphate cytidylyltransferase [Planctomycetota bacterium]
MSPDITAVVLAAGQGRRMGGTNKALLPLAGRPVLHYSMTAFAQCPSVAQLILVMNDADVLRLQEQWQMTPADLGADLVVPGGAERWLSSLAGCQMAEHAVVLVHDAARALITPSTIEAVAAATRKHGAALAAHPLADTLKREAAGGKVAETVARENLWCAQTPQGFKRDLLLRAFTHWQQNHDHLPTDEAMLAEAAGIAPMLVAAPSSNFKLTTPADLALAESLLHVAASTDHA